MPIIAEDLGVITPDVDALRKKFGFPGMRILQFAFAGDASDRFLPHNYEPDTVVYTGTHDNDTVAGWWATATDYERHHARGYLATDGHDMPWTLIRAAMASVADTAVHPMQDVLALPTDSRMNYLGRPGQESGWWGWRFAVAARCRPWHAGRLLDLSGSTAVSAARRQVGAAAVGHFGRHADAFAQRRVRVDGLADVHLVGAHLDGQRHLADHVAGVRADDAAAQDAVASRGASNSSLVKPSSRPLAMARPEAVHGNRPFLTAMPWPWRRLRSGPPRPLRGRCRPRWGSRGRRTAPCCRRRPLRLPHALRAPPCAPASAGRRCRRWQRCAAHWCASARPPG
jgi:hypothetical protein